MPGRARGVTPEEPAAGNLHGGIREGGDLRRAMVDLAGHEAGNGGYSQGEPKAHRASSTRSAAQYAAGLCSVASLGRPEWRSRAGLCTGIDEMRCGAPSVTRKRFEASDSVDPSNRLVCTQRSTGCRAECHFAVVQLQLAKCFRAVFKLDHCLVGS